ncbi:MAG TPA: carbohydrate ABC transporter permease [Anaerolineae bacterium]|jgi:ABC-type glycerol-3-phosphate transport system permease component
MKPNQPTPTYLKRSTRYYAFSKGAQPWIYNLLLVIVCLFMMLPVLGTILTSLKRQVDVQRKPPLLLPCDTPEQDFDITACRFVTEGYERVIDIKPNDKAILGFEMTGRMFSIYIPNTLLYAVAASLLVTVFAGMAGYAFSRYKFRGRRAIQVAILAITGVPLLTNLISLYQIGVALRKAMPGYEERIFLIFVYVGFFLPFSIWIVKSFFDTIPRELEEASFIDGCTPVQALYLIVAPLAAPGLTSAFLLSFVGIWNEFIAGYLLVSKNALKTAMFGLYDFLGQYVIGYQVLAAACILIALPVVILFLFARPVFFRAMVEGALKG